MQEGPMVSHFDEIEIIWSMHYLFQLVGTTIDFITNHNTFIIKSMVLPNKNLVPRYLLFFKTKVPMTFTIIRE